MGLVLYLVHTARPTFSIECPLLESKFKLTSSDKHNLAMVHQVSRALEVKRKIRHNYCKRRNFRREFNFVAFVK